MNTKQQKHTIDVLFVISLFCIFALSSIFLISIGANIYRKTIQHMDSNFNTRTAVAYITEKVRQSDDNQQIHVGFLEEHPAIILTSERADILYQTYIYEYDGSLRELMMRADTPLSASAGQDIVDVRCFDVTAINDSLMQCFIQSDNESPIYFYITAHTGGLSNEY